MSQLQQFLRGATKVSYSNASSGLTAVTVQAAIDELDLTVDGVVADAADLRTLSGTADGDTDLGTFTGATIADASTIKAALQALETAHEEVDANANDLITLSGMPENSTDLGTFTGTTIADSSTVKGALQALETAHETTDGLADDLVTLSGVAANSTDLGTFTGTTIADSSTVKGALQALETAHEETDANADDLVTLSGVAENSTDLGTFTGSTITDANTVKGALQELETSLETKAADADVIKKDGSVAFTADQSMGGFKLTNLGTPTAAGDAATKAYVDSNSAGLDPKESCRVATTANIANLSSGAPNVVDGITLVADDRVLVRAQTDPKQNGIYVVTAPGTGSDGIWGRASDHDGSPANEVSAGNFTFIEQGTTYADIGFVLTGDGEITLGVEDVVWTQFSGAGSFNAGDGLGQSGSTIFVNVDDDTIEINADTLRLKADGVDDSHIDFGTGAGQVNAADLPLVAGTGITATDVDGALVENRAAIDAIEDNTITSPNGSLSTSGTVGGDDQQLDVVFSTSGAANRSIQASDLASTANGVGASMVGIEDSGALITATTVEGALAENRGAIDALEDNTITSPNGSLSLAGTVGGDNQTADVVFSTTGAANRSIEASALASTSASEGASMVGIQDAGGLITATTVEGALAENRTAVDAIEDNTITSPLGTLSSTGTIGADNQQLEVQFSTTGAANRSIEAQSLASTSTGEGASMVGVEDAAGNWTSTDVEGVLVEVDSRLDALEAGGTADWAIKTTAYTAVDGDKLLADTTSAAFTITLPASPSAGDEVIIRDAKRTSETNAITVARNGENIGGLAEDMTIAINGVQTHLVYVDAAHGWSVNAT